MIQRGSGQESLTAIRSPVLAGAGSCGAFDCELECQYVGAYWADAANTARYPGHTVTNVRVRYRLGAASSLGLRVTNLFDRAYADRADLSFGAWRYFPGRSRAAFIDVAHAWR